MKISRYLSLEEATKSPTAIRLGLDNQPNPEQLKNMIFVATEIFDPVRQYIQGPLYASSFFRSPELNAAIGGSSKTSQHMSGEAIDIDADVFNYSTNVEIFYFIKDHLIWDQLIGEYPNPAGDFSWVHVSKTRTGNRGEVLIKLKDKYIQFKQYKVGMK
jgi:zinc D-Ala-D-Ala carboxypeptidase